MNKADITKLIALCSINYKNFPEVGKEEMLIELWNNMLEDVPYELGEVAIKKYISESVYPPTIADIRQRVADISKPRVTPSIEAWGNVTKVIRKYGSYNEAKALAELDDLTRKTVEYFGYRDLCISENGMADRAHFLKTYETMAERVTKENLLSPKLTNYIESAQIKRLT